MRRPSLQRLAGGSATCVGIGLVALDLVVNGEEGSPHQFQTGGSCGNVLAILSYLGWKSYPIARLGQDPAGKLVHKDLAQFGISPRFLIEEPSGQTPIIIEVVHATGRGHRTHSFRWHCPNCGTPLPRHRLLGKGMADQIRNDLPKAAVLYFDRVSSGSLLLARHYRDAGALIVFEPSSAGDEKLVKKAIALAHIVKYSRQRLSGLTEALGDIFVPLEIETLGREGLRFRRRRTAQDTAQWQSLPAYEVPDLLDEAGSGDWCTAGILHSLARHGAASFSRSRDPGLARAFTLGQALAAANCSFPGARGAMYELSLNEFAEAVQKATKGQPLTHNREPTNASEIHCLLEALCTHCRPPLAKFQS